MGSPLENRSELITPIDGDAITMTNSLAQRGFYWHVSFTWAKWPSTWKPPPVDMLGATRCSLWHPKGIHHANANWDRKSFTGSTALHLSILLSDWIKLPNKQLLDSQRGDWEGFLFSSTANGARQEWAKKRFIGWSSCQHLLTY